MTTDPIPDDFDYSTFIDDLIALGERAIAQGAAPGGTAAAVLQASFGVAYKNGLPCSLRHILHMQDEAEDAMRDFHRRYDHRFDLKGLIHDRVVPKV